VVFSGLADVAGEIGRPSDDLKRVEEQEALTYLAEMEFLKANLAVFSNAKNYRRRFPCCTHSQPPAP